MAASDRRDVHADPCWRPEDLGHPLPDDPHAVSVCLPTWQDNVDYEEGSQRVHQRLRAGYPRFALHPAVRRLSDAAHARFAAPGEVVTLAPDAASARRIGCHLDHHGAYARILEWGAAGVRVVVLPVQAEHLARQCWQHAGIIVSSRQACAALAGRDGGEIAGQTARLALRERLAGWYGVDLEDVFLDGNGMAACARAVDAVRSLAPGRPTAQLGFPYVDLLKYQGRFGPGVRFWANGAAAPAALAADLDRDPLAGVVIEVPSNPLLSCPDLAGLADLLRPRHLPLVVDDTIATPFNCDLLDAADLIFSSLTKYVAGLGDCMGGAIVVSPHSPWRTVLRQRLCAGGDGHLWSGDAVVLEGHARSAPARVAAINHHARVVIDHLRRHPAVARVHYPDACPRFAAVRRPGAGNGGLCAFELERPQRAPAVFDALQVNKGPSLGTTFTLACPFTLLAHYRELEWAESCGVSRWLIRLSIGTEDPDLTWRRLRAGLEA